MCTAYRILKSKVKDKSKFWDQRLEQGLIIFFYIMIYKYTFNTHNKWLIIKKSTIIRLEHTKTRSIQNGVCLVGLRILYSNL